MVLGTNIVIAALGVFVPVIDRVASPAGFTYVHLGCRLNELKSSDARLDGCALTVKRLLIALVSPPVVAVIRFDPCVVILKSLNVATPLTSVTCVSVPLTVPVPVVSVMLTAIPLVGTVFPKLSLRRTVTGGAMVWSATVADGCCTNAS